MKSLRVENDWLRELLDQHLWWFVYLLLTIALLVLSVASVWTWSYLQPKGTLSCASFGSYGQMKAAFDTGKNPQLDRDNDGKPCESHGYPGSPKN